MYTEDKRKGLNELCTNYQLVLGLTVYTILGEIGRGGNAIVYEAKYKDNQGNEHHVLIKELFPFSDNNVICRNESGELHIDNSLNNQRKLEVEDYFKRNKNSFERGNRKNSELILSDANNLMGNRDIYEKNNTLYSVHDKVFGKTLRKIIDDRKYTHDLSGLRSITYIIINTLKVLRIFHKSKELHLDISPENIFVCDNEQGEQFLSDGTRRVILIDYNSTWNMEVDVNDEEFCFTAKYGYSAFELRTCNKCKINRATDLFSVCAVFFEMLQDRVQEHEDRITNDKNNIDLNNKYCEDIPETAIYLCNKILNKGLKNSNNKRYQTIDELLDDLKELIRRIDGIAGITHNCLWEGSKKYFERVISAGGFLSVLDTIYPDNKMFDINIKINRTKTTLLIDSIISLWEQKNWHGLLVGEGGMGKTVSLTELWKHFVSKYDEKMPVPIYIRMNEYNQLRSYDEKKYFIIKKISKYYLNQPELDKDELNALNRIFNTPIKDSKHVIPSFILLLDGFNEISLDNSEIVNEMNYLIDNSLGIQIIITSRIDIRETYNMVGKRMDIGRRAVNLLELQKLSYKDVLSFLKEYGYKSVKGKLLDLITNPMMLAVYSSTLKLFKNYDKINILNLELKAHVETPGELLWNFFQSQIIKRFHFNNNANDQELLYFRFIVTQLFPYLGFEMEKKGVYSLKYEELRKLVDIFYDVICKRDLLKEPYCDYQYDLFIDELEICTQNKGKRFRNILQLCMSILVKIESSNYEYEFIHQNFRDFFAAMYLVNEIKYGLSMQCVSDALKKNTISFYVTKYIGEILGEHYNIPKLLCDRWIIEESKGARHLLRKSLNICRGIYNGTLSIAVWNIIEILKNTRGEITGEDLSRLDLSKVEINNIRCFRFYKNKFLSVDFSQSIIGDKNILSQGHFYSINRIYFSSSKNTILSSSKDHSFKEWDIITRECIRTYKGHTGSVNSAIYSNDGKKILSASKDKTIIEWDDETEKWVKKYEGHTASVNSAVYSNDGKKILSASDDKTIKEWDVETRKCIKTYGGHAASVNSAVYSDDGKKILSASDDNTIKEWDIITKECITYKGHVGSVNSAAYSDDGKKILSASDDNTIKEWDIVTRECITYKGHAGSVNSAVYSDDGKRILSASDDNTIKEWDIETRKNIKTFEECTGSVNSAVYGYGGRKILSASDDKTIKEWDIETGLVTNKFNGRSEWLNATVYSNDEKRFLSPSWDYTIKEWDIDNKKCIKIFIGHTSYVTTSVYSKDNKKLLSASWDYTIKEWDVETGECIHTYVGHTQGVNSAVYSNDGKKILSVSDDKTIREWDVETCQCIKIFLGHSSNVTSGIYSNNDKKILSASADRTIKEWDVETKKCINTYYGHTDWVTKAIYNKDNTRILSTSYDKTIKEWDVETKICIKTFVGHLDYVKSAIYSNDGKKILSVSIDKTIIEWDVENMEIVNVLRGHLHGVVSAIYNRIGNKVLSASWDTTIKEWDVNKSTCINTYKNASGLFINNCNFEKLHDKSNISEYCKKVLKTFNANV